jgi:hypothetical protein
MMKKKILSRIADGYPNLNESLLVFKIISQRNMNNHVKDLLTSHNAYWLRSTIFI